MISVRQRKQSDGIKYIEREKEKPINIDVNALKEVADERSSKYSLLRKILSFFKKDKHYSEIVVNGILPKKRVAVLVDGVLEGIEMDTDVGQQMFASIFKGSIQNLEPGLKAAFVDIGREKNAFLHYWDILPLVNGEGLNENGHDEGVEVVYRNVLESEVKKFDIEDIPKKFPIGSSIVVQVIKSQTGSKGPRVTTNISLPGRYLVLTPFSNQCGISRKIENVRDRQRLKKILYKMTLPKGMGVVFRTASAGSTLKQLTRDLQFLLDTWKKIQERVDVAKNPCLVYHEPNLLERTVRDFLTEAIDRVLVDNKTDFQYVVDLLGRIAPNMQKKVVWYKDPIPIFDRYNVEAQICQLFSSRVPLPSGGEIVIQETEALTSIDVNTSSHKADNEESFVLQVNLEAAREVVHQVRLRNIGGIIIVDFIDMKQIKHRKMLYEFVKEEFQCDKARVQILPISVLGIMQISRQRHNESFLRQLYSQCHYCRGEGILKSSLNLAMCIQREIISQRICLKSEMITFVVTLNPYLKSYILSRCAEDFKEMENRFKLKVQFKEDDNVHVENFKIMCA